MHIEDPYTFLIHEIIEQMLSIKSGAVIYKRLEDLCNGNITPTAVAHLSDDQIKSIGTSTSKVSYIRSVTDAMVNHDLDFNKMESLSDDEVIASLLSIRGIGNWTAKMFLIFVLNRQDILPYEDAAFRQSFKWLYKTSDCSEKNIIDKCKKWKPYSSIASRYLYRALDTGLTKTAFT